MNDKESIYRAAISVWGKDAQENQAIEEMAELIQAINKMRRQPSPEHLDDLKEELADVQIMLDQLRLIHRVSDGELQFYEAQKLQRLQKRLEHLLKKEATNA